MPGNRTQAFKLSHRLKGNNGGEEREEQTEQIGLVNVNMVNIQKEDTYPVVFSFQPTTAFLNMLLFFDQYQHSATIWSPDSNNVILAATPTVEGRPVIMVSPASGKLEPRLLIDGVLTFWSWE